MNTSPARPRPTVPVVLASVQLAVAVTGLGCAVAHAIREQQSISLFGGWDRVPIPLVITASAIATVVLIRRGRCGGAMTAAVLPLVIHVLAVVSLLPLSEGFPFGSWVRQALTLPLGEERMSPYPVLAKITDWACMAAIVLGVVVAVGLAGSARRQKRRSPVPPGAPAVVVVTSVLAMVAYWAGEHLSQLPDRAGPTRLAVVALAAAMVTAVIDAHTRWAAREGMTAVAAVSAGVSGVVLIVPLGWLLWPLIQQWLWPLDRQGYVFSQGYYYSSSTTRWQGLAEGLISLSLLLGLVAVAAAALTAAHRAAAAARGTATHTED